MNIRRGEVHEVVSFYSFLQVPVDVVRVCTGPVCDCIGARPGAGELAVACVGHCDLAPVRMHGDEIVGGVTHRTNGFLLEPDELRDPPDLIARRGAGAARGRRRSPAWAAPASRRFRKWDAVRARARAAGRDRQRRRGRARDDQGPLRDGASPAAAARGTRGGDALLRGRRGVRLPARGVRDLACAPARGDRRPRAERARSSSAPARTSAARRSAMLESMEGRRGMPRLRPPFPAQKGYLGRPTLINNVETLAHVARILRGEHTPVRLWSVSGAVHEPGCYEAPLDVTAAAADRRLRRRRDRGDRRGRPRRRGERDPPAGGARRAAHARRRSREWGSGPGSAGGPGLPGAYPVLRLLAETMRFFAEESCQKCTPCRIGNRALHHVVEELEHGRAAMSREKVDEWLEAMAQTSICGLGQASPDPGAQRLPPLARADGGASVSMAPWSRSPSTAARSQRARGRAARPRARPARRLRPDALPRRQARPVRRLPDVRRRRRGLAAAAARLRDTRRRGHGRLDELVRPAVPADADRDAALRAPERATRPAGRTS